jgi:hypothetical protein
MSDAAIAQEPIEPVPPAPPGPEATAELEAALVSTVDTSPSPLEAVEAPGATAPEQPDAADPPEDSERRSLPGVDHLGVLRRSVLDALIDNERPLSVAEIIAHMPVGPTRGSAESAIKREFDAGRIMRTSPGHYTIAPARPEPPKPAPSPDPPAKRSDGMTDQDWLAALEAWHVDPSTWNVVELGPAPNVPNNVPPEVKARFNDRLRKREERRRDAEAATTARAAADEKLRNQLLAVCCGNVMQGSPGLNDMAPVRLMMQVVPLEHILVGLKRVVDRRINPQAAPIGTWRDERFHEAVARRFLFDVALPRMIAAWKVAGTGSAPKTPGLPPAARMPDDIDELRGLHDSPSAPPGPHDLRKPGDTAPDVPANAAGASEAPAAVEVSPEPERAPAVPPSMPDDRPAIDAEPGLEHASDLPDSEAPEVAAAPAVPAAVGREQILAAFNRPRQPQPAPPQHQPAQRQAERPWFSGAQVPSLKTR